MGGGEEQPIKLSGSIGNVVKQRIRVMNMHFRRNLQPIRLTEMARVLLSVSIPLYLHPRYSTINVSPPYKLPAKFRLKRSVARSSSRRLQQPVARIAYDLSVTRSAFRSPPLLPHCALVKRGPIRGRGRPRKIHSYRSKYLAADGRLRAALTMNEEYIRGMKADWMRHLNGHGWRPSMDQKLHPPQNFQWGEWRAFQNARTMISRSALFFNWF